MAVGHIFTQREKQMPVHGRAAQLVLQVECQVAVNLKVGSSSNREKINSQTARQYPRSQLYFHATSSRTRFPNVQGKRFASSHLVDPGALGISSGNNKHQLQPAFSFDLLELFSCGGI